MFRVHDATGEPITATFDVEADDGSLSLVLHSAGGGASRRGHVPAARNRPLRREKRCREEGAAHRSLILYRADWLLPIARPPVRAGGVVVSRGRILACGAAAADPPTSPGVVPEPVEIVDLGRVAILPGLVNAHTHLELSACAGRFRPPHRCRNGRRT